MPKLPNNPLASPSPWQFSAYENVDIVVDRKNKRKIKRRGWG